MISLIIFSPCVDPPAGWVVGPSVGPAVEPGGPGVEPGGPVGPMGGFGGR